MPHKGQNDRHKSRSDDLFSRINVHGTSTTVHKNYSSTTKFKPKPKGKYEPKSNSSHKELNDKRANPFDNLKVYDDENTGDVLVSSNSKSKEDSDELDKFMPSSKYIKKDTQKENALDSSKTSTSKSETNPKSPHRSTKPPADARPVASSKRNADIPIRTDSSERISHHKPKTKDTYRNDNNFSHDSSPPPKPSRNGSSIEDDLSHPKFSRSNKTYNDRFNDHNSSKPKHRNLSQSPKRSRREKERSRERERPRSYDKDKLFGGKYRHSQRDSDRHSDYDDQYKKQKRGYRNTQESKRRHEEVENDDAGAKDKDFAIPKGPSSWRSAQSKPVYEFREKDRHHDDVRFDERPSRRWHSESGPEESRQRPHSNHKSQKHSVTSFLESSFLSYNRGSIFKRTCQVGEGTYGKVYKAVNIKTNNMVALKRLRLEAERDGVPITAVREIKLLQSLQHNNIVQLQEMMVEQNQFYMVFEYTDHDLAGLLAIPDLKLSLGNIKYMFRQAMEGLAFVHHRGVLHRDIKGSNILVTSSGQVKLADFGLARSINMYVRPSDAMYTNRVITLWYRPPELLLGETHYDGSVDIWGMGCLLIEFFTRKAIFQGNEEVSQLLNIYKTMGTPDQNGWSEAQSLPWYSMLAPSRYVPSRFAELYQKSLPSSVFSLAEKMLQLNPKNRLTAHQVLQDELFHENPPEQVPTQIKDLKGEWHDFEAKQRKKKAREVIKRKEREQLQDQQRQQSKQQKAEGESLGNHAHGNMSTEVGDSEKNGSK